MAMTPNVWTLNGLAAETGLDRRTLAKRLVGVTPADEKGDVKLYRLADVLPALGLGATPNKAQLDLTAERARLAKEQADKTAIQNEERRGEIIPVADVIERWTRIAETVKRRLLGLPSKVAPRLAMKPVSEVFRVLDEQVRETLIELSGERTADRKR